MLSTNEVTARTKLAVKEWSHPPEGTPIYLDTRLVELRSNYLEELRNEVNREFRGEPGMPISKPDWEELAPTIVRNLQPPSSGTPR
jgi:hypothetical protein